MVVGDPDRPRHAPYTSASSFRDLLERMRGLPVPDRVDRKYLAKLGVARNNEWALLSALKYLAIVDDRGVPTAAWNDLRGEHWRAVLRTLVKEAYRPLLDNGGASMSADDLRTYFSVTSSTAQAQNAARFFREVRDLAGLGREASQVRPIEASRESIHHSMPVADTGARVLLPSPPSSVATGSLSPEKLQLVLALARPGDQWTPEQQLALCDRILRILEHLDGESPPSLDG